MILGVRCRSKKFTGFHILIILLFSVSLSPEPWWIMPITSPFRLKFLKYFQIRYLESQNVLSVPDCLNQGLKVKLLGSLFNLPDFDSWNGVNSKTKWASFGILIWSSATERSAGWKPVRSDSNPTHSQQRILICSQRFGIIFF